MEKIKDMNCYMRVILDGLQLNKPGLVRNYDHWKEWKLSTISRGLREVDCGKSYTNNCEEKSWKKRQ